MRSRLIQPLAGLMALLLFVPPPSAWALLNIDGTRNQVFVFGNASFGYDSNIFSSPTGEGDYTIGAAVGVELKRRAGIISVNARAQMEYVGFEKLSEQNAWNPSLYLELNKTIGRTTGAFTINAFRSSRADSAVNLRTQSWNFPLGLNVKYPINDNLYVTSSTGYLRRSYTDSASGLLTYTDYSEGIDLFYVYTSKLDLLGGYRIRVGTTELGTSTDHSLTAGVTNGIFPKVNGTIRVGYQWRTLSGTGESYNQLTTAIGLTWNATRKLNVGLNVSRDFSTTATGGTVDSLAAQMRGEYEFNRKYSVSAGLGYGLNKFLGVDPAREDSFFQWDVGARVHWSEHLEISATYSYLINWSTSSNSDFERSGYSLNISSRY